MRKCITGQLAQRVTFAIAAAHAGAATAQDRAPHTLLSSDQTALQAAPNSAASAQTPNTSDVIIVTANKRRERELDVAGAIKAFTGDQLLRQGTVSLKDYAQLTPGLTINPSLGAGNPIIRGIGTGVEVGSLTGMVVNGAQIGASSSFSTSGNDSLDLDPIDLQRVEVLKGPQGTIYGANTLAGIVSYTLRDPDLKETTFIGRVGLGEVEHGGTDWSVRGTVSLPLVTDKVALRLSGFRDRAAGFVDNHVRGLTDQNTSSKWGLNGSFLAVPTDRLRIMISGFYQHTNAARDTVIYDFVTHRPRDGDLQYNDYLFPIYRSTIRAVIGTIDYDFGFAKLSTVSAYQNTHSYNGANGTNGALGTLIIPSLPFFGGVPVPFPSATRIAQDSHVRKFTQEARLTSASDGPLQWMLGGYFAHENVDVLTPAIQTTTTGVEIPSLAPAVAFDQPLGYREYAGFGNATYRFSRAFDLTAGIRVGQIDQSYQQSFFGSDAAAFNTLFGLFGFPPIPAQTPTTKASKTVVTYLATARYHISSDTMFFARYATGFRPGGPNLLVLGLPATYKPDTTENFEAGLKTKFWAGKGTLDLVGYYTKWHDIIVAVSSNGLAGLGNGGDARVYGLESSVSVRPFAGLSLTGTLAYSNGEIRKVDPLGVGILGVGDPLPNNPRWSGSLFGNYQFPLSGRWYADVGGTARFATQRHAVFKSGTGFPDYVLPGYGLLDVRAGLHSDKLDVDLFVRNVTDKRAQLGAYTFYGIAEVTVQRPRTFGITVTARQ